MFICQMSVEILKKKVQIASEYCFITIIICTYSKIRLVSKIISFVKGKNCVKTYQQFDRILLDAVHH